MSLISAEFTHPPSELTEELREGCLVRDGFVDSHLLLPPHVAERAAADAHGHGEPEGRADGHREEPAAGGLAAQPHPGETREAAVDERVDAADAGGAL